ncbi:OsmC family protein [Pseudomonadota bacterium]
MQAFPHHYKVQANAGAEGNVVLSGADKDSMESAPPAEFDGPGDLWSPEDLLVASVADCFILSFRAISKMSKLPWASLECRVEGTLDRVERLTQFTEFKIFAKLTIGVEEDVDKAERLLQKAEETCLISNSLKAVPHLETEVVVG